MFFLEGAFEFPELFSTQTPNPPGDSRRYQISSPIIGHRSNLWVWVTFCTHHPKGRAPGHEKLRWQPEIQKNNGPNHVIHGAKGFQLPWGDLWIPSIQMDPIPAWRVFPKAKCLQSGMDTETDTSNEVSFLWFWMKRVESEEGPEKYGSSFCKTSWFFLFLLHYILEGF